jgi:hypothetical protein
LPIPVMALVQCPLFMVSELEQSLLNYGVTPVYAFSERQVIEQRNPDGSVTTINATKDVGVVCNVLPAVEFTSELQHRDNLIAFVTDGYGYKPETFASQERVKLSHLLSN